MGVILTAVNDGARAPTAVLSLLFFWDDIDVFFVGVISSDSTPTIESSGFIDADEFFFLLLDFPAADFLLELDFDATGEDEIISLDSGINAADDGT